MEQKLYSQCEKTNPQIMKKLVGCQPPDLSQTLFIYDCDMILVTL